MSKRSSGAGSVGISAIAYALPERALDLGGLHERRLLDSSPAVLAEFGFCCAYISDRPAHELALVALRRLLAQTAIDPESVDAIYFAGAIPSSHHVIPDGSALSGFTYPVARLQYECGLMNAEAVGISQNGCTGLMTAVSMAADHLMANPAARAVICISADVLPAGARREIIYNVISDGACALLVERDAARNRLLARTQITKGYYWNACVGRNEIVAAYFPTARAIVDRTLADAGITVDDIAAVMPHNVSRRSWEILLPMLGIPMSRLFAENIPRTGHVIAADNFINLCDAIAAERVRPGDRALLFSFGFGANWASMVLEV